MSTAVMPATTTAGALRRLYFVRFGFAIAWAIALALTAASLTPISIALLVVYPLFDAAAAVVDFRTSDPTGPRAALRVNLTLSLATAVALAVAVTSGIPAALVAWGVWAITAGVVQLVVAIRRRRLGGQWAMIFSGGLSTFAGTGFILMASGPEPSLTGLAGYATVGGVFFLVSAIRLGRNTKAPE
ncbi:membrane protein [Glycomyces sp. NRRL B-16210]|uniref:membrane protein n=1 Tax=Glycomyces sp. NRRL B-16210 TaxID=1463821 RepID=UPI0004C20951|nr:membrane protein [Glycomyces sp. NRRL B-16210]